MYLEECKIKNIVVTSNNFLNVDFIHTKGCFMQREVVDLERGEHEKDISENGEDDTHIR